MFTYYYKCSNKKLCRVATLMSFFGKYRYHYQKGQERASCVSHGSIKRISYLCNAYAAAGCALSSSHPTTRAFRFPCSACAAVGCALPCCIRLPITIAALQCMIFFSIGLLVLIGLCFFYRLETSAPGLSGYYWYLYSCSFISDLVSIHWYCQSFRLNSWWFFRAALSVASFSCDSRYALRQQNLKMRTYMEKMAQTQKRHSMENRGKNGAEIWIHVDRFRRKVW